MDHAMLIPSKVLVPLPISSRIIRLLSVALFKILAVSFISTMNVDIPFWRWSCAPTREKILSTILICAESAGMKLPIWAINVINDTCRRYVDLPAMLGPVIIIIWSSELLSWVSLAINWFSGMIRSMRGCRPFLIVRWVVSKISGFV